MTYKAMADISLIPTSAPELPAITRLLALTRLMMDAATQLREQINAISSELVARGIHSAKIDNATYSIETLVKAYVDNDTAVNWAEYRLTGKERRLTEVLHKRMGKNTTRDSILDAMYFDNINGCDHIVSPRKIVDVFVCKVRKKIRNSPFAIENDCGSGYRMVLKPIPKPVYNALDALSAAR